MRLQVDGKGGYVNFADQTNFPASTTMLGALVKFGPGGLRQLHWHPTLDEWQFIINGTFEVRPCQESLNRADLQAAQACVVVLTARQPVYVPCM